MTCGMYVSFTHFPSKRWSGVNVENFSTGIKYKNGWDALTVCGSMMHIGFAYHKEQGPKTARPKANGYLPNLHFSTLSAVVCFGGGDRTLYTALVYLTSYRHTSRNTPIGPEASHSFDSDR